MNERIEKILEARRGHVQIFGEVENLVVKQEIPRNGYLIQTDPSVFVQFGKRGFIITDGSLWLDEDMEEGDIEGQNTFWKYIGNGKWKVHNEATLWLPKDVVINEITDTIVEELPPDQMPRDFSGIVYWTEEAEIFIDGDKVVEKIYEENENIDTHERYLWNFMTWAKIEEGNVKYVLPVSSLNKWLADSMYYLLVKDTKLLEELGIIYASNPKKLKLVNLPEPPKNAWLISVDSPLWLQLGKGKYIVTRGVFWLDEGTEETRTEDFGWYYDDEKERWVIRLKEPEYISGDYVTKDNRIMPIHLADDPEYEHYRMFNWWIKIYDENRDTIVQEGCIICDGEEDDDEYYEFLFKKDILSFMKVSVYDDWLKSGIELWVPKYYTLY